jgi:hypothetical protein
MCLLLTVYRRVRKFLQRTRPSVIFNSYNAKTGMIPGKEILVAIRSL